MKRFGFAIAVIGMFFIANANNVFGQGRIVGRFGDAIVGGQRVFVHVTVAVPPGLDEDAVADNAVRGQGGRPIRPAEYATTGLVWDQFFNASADRVDQYYNPANAPLNAAASLQNAQNEWTNVAESQFVFAYQGTTSRCPSLVQECPGAQAFDGNNDVGWIAIGGCCTLAVTWYSTSIDEADMALNTNFPWTTGGGSGYDVETVILHEEGHALGLGHSAVTGAVMEATYAGPRHLHDDDRRGVAFLYPETSVVGNISGTVRSATTNAPIAGAMVSIANPPISATTLGDGTYVLQGVPDIGSYSVTATASGYSSQTINNVGVPQSNVDFSLTGSSGGGGTGCIPRGRFGNNCK